jgi:hypothetical protein
MAGQGHIIHIGNPGTVLPMNLTSPNHHTESVFSNQAALAKSVTCKRCRRELWLR